MAHPGIRHPPAHHPPNNVLHPMEYEQLEVYHVPEEGLDQPIHFAEQPAYISPTPSNVSNQPAPFAQYTSLVGRTITSPSGGRFRLAFRRVLGVGAYGVVYLAEEIEREETRYSWFNPSTPSSRHEREPTISTEGRMYAVKVMRCSPRGSRQRAFQAREVALHRKADGHPGVVPLHAVYGTGPPPSWSPRKRKAWSSHSHRVRPEDELRWDRDAELSGGPLPTLEDGMPEELVYMVLSYVGGGDLFTMIAERQRYIGDDTLIRSVFVQLLDAVEWCHARGVRHRDLKPENVLCEEDGRTVFVSDFGLATTEQRSRDFGCGSSYYMSPECYGDPQVPANSPSYDTRANDVWTLGVVLVNLATGRNPWEAASPLDPTFTSFCADPDNFLMSILPITPAANAVLVRVFDRDQSRRCSISELKEMVLNVKRWTLRGSELDGAGEGARDVARGCGLLDAPVERDEVEMGRAGSNGSAGMVERSRFSEDTVLDREDELEEDEVDWSMYGLGRARSESVCSSTSASSEMNRSRPLSKILSNSPTLMGPTWDQTEPEPEVDDQPLSTGTDPVSPKSRPESIPRWPKIVQGWDVGEPDPEEPRTPPLDVFMPNVEAATPRAVVTTTPRPVTGTETTPRATSKPATPAATTPRGIVAKDSTPRTETRLKAPGGVVEFGVSRAQTPNSTLRTPRSTPSLKTPRSNPTLQAPKSGARLADISRSSSGSRSPVQRPGLLSSPFTSKIPRYTGSSRTRTVSFEPPSRLAAKEAGRERMRSAPSPGQGATPTKEKAGGLKPKVSFGDLSAMALARLRSKTSSRELRSKGSGSTLHSRSSTRELHSKASISTIASSVSSGFPGTPLRAEVILASPRVIVSHPSDGKLWDMPRSSGSSLWDASSSHTTHYSGETQGEVPIHRPLAPLQPGAPLFDATARLVDPNTLYRSKAWGMSSPSLSRTYDEEPAPAPAAEPVFARWRNIGSGSPRAESGGSPPKRKIKRVPVPPIPSELLEEHERQMTLKRHGAAGQMFELSVEAPDGKVAPPPGLALDDRNGECRPGPKRLLENARAWFRRI